MKLRNIPCNLCGTNNTRLITTEREFNVCKCKNCSLIYVNLQPYEMEGNSLGYYDYWDTSEDSIKSRIAAHKNVFMHGIRILERISYGKKGKLLDIGCGYGHFLKLAKERGWKVTGQDISMKACEYTEVELGINVYCGYLESINFPDSHFDVITMWFVLEHVDNPFSLLMEAKQILKPGGMLLVRVPNVSRLHYLRWLIRRARRKPFLYLGGAPAHLYGFTPKTIRMFFDKLDFKRVKFYPTRSVGTGGFKNHCVGIVTTISTLLTGGQCTLGPILVCGRKDILLDDRS